MHQKRRSALVAAAVALVTTFAAAGPAAAASTSGTASCGGTYVVRLTSDTGGSTLHRWTNASTGATKSTTWTSGGVHASLGYQYSQWVLTASTIASSSTTCIQ